MEKLFALIYLEGRKNGKLIAFKIFGLEEVIGAHGSEVRGVSKPEALYSNDDVTHLITVND